MTVTYQPLLAQEILKSFPYVFKNGFASRTILNTRNKPASSLQSPESQFRLTGEFTEVEMLKHTGDKEVARFWVRNGTEYCYHFTNKA